MPERNYGLFGPFEIPRAANGRVDQRVLGDFWEKAEAGCPGLAKASGCYIFGIRAAKGARPWYVGQARKAFKRECFTDSKLLRYNTVLADQDKGTPILFLLARMTPGGRFKMSLGVREAGWVESMLIHHCLDANGDLLNVSGTALSTEVVIPGLFRSPPGKPTPEARFLKTLLSL